MTNRTLQKKFFRAGTAIAGLAVALGAFGAHALREKLSEDGLRIYDTGVRYQFIHAFAILVIAVFMRKLREKVAVTAFRLFVLGIILFSGSLYLLATQKILLGTEYRWIGIITPVGGISFISGWLLLATRGYRVPQVRRHESAVRSHSHPEDEFRV